MNAMDVIPGWIAESLEALGEPGMVERLLARLGAHMGSHKVVLFCPRPGRDAALACHQAGMPDDFLHRYAALIQVQDAWTAALERQHAQALARGGSLSQQLIATRDLRRTPFYADYLRPLGIDAMVNGIVEDSPEVGTHVLAMYNELGQDEFSPAQFAWLQTVTPWVRTLMRAQRRFERQQRHNQRLEQSLDALPLGLLHATPGGEVRYLNEHARQWLRIDDECRILLRQATGWQARTPQTLAQIDQRLQRLLADCLRQAVPVSVRLRTGDEHPLFAVATPLRGAATPLVQVVLVPEMPQYSAATVSICAALYGLTPAEAALLPLLLQGMTPREMADTQGVKLPTVRTQLASLFAKTGTRRQAELAQRVMRVTTLVAA
ncbi:helix-turn-helix transcriptional regulator [Ottowia testudinis]|uniref:Helix-turn-helix transcriptional regulator n=1 Tax=Ottowia testudinis TaxID=2816950 RepID=A0A975H2H1_9BURK|nr:helix-turn-helix transcriptional regulator [Ottowia testudinis]QTD44175.1 helix-turn-helix transcriptional regulator [Ottowia testudinis]